MSDYKTEFPTYHDPLPFFIPMRDASWHKDACPRFTWDDEEDPDLAGCVIDLWCDWADPAQREIPDYPRFIMQVSVRESYEGNTIIGQKIIFSLDADTLDDLREELNKWYEEHVGYRPDDDMMGTEGQVCPLGQLIVLVGQMVYLRDHGSDADDGIYVK